MTTTAPAPTRVVAAARNAWADPMSRAGYSLLLNTGVTGVLGFAYWLVAARLFDKAAVGRAGAIVSALALLSGVGMLNLSGTLMRFLPTAGRQSRRLVLLVYGAAAVAATVLAVVVVGCYQAFAPAGATLRLPWWQDVVFVATVTVTAVFTLQDSVLIGLRRAPVVPVENAGFGIAKIALLAVFAPVGSAFVLFSSWAVPLFAVVPVVNLFIFRRWLPAGRFRERYAAPERAEIRRFIQGDATGGLLQTASSYLLPIIVTVTLGAVSNANFYVAFLFAGTLELLAANLASSLTVEGAHTPEKLPALVRATYKRAATLLLPCLALLALAAPLVLHVYGKSYDDAVTVLRLLLVAVVPKAVLTVFYSVCRVRHKTHISATIEAAIFVVTVVLVALTAHAGGLAGVGLTVVLVQCAAAVVGFVIMLRLLRSPA